MTVSIKLITMTIAALAVKCTARSEVRLANLFGKRRAMLDRSFVVLRPVMVQACKELQLSLR